MERKQMHECNGMYLFEVLISLLILSIMLLGFDAALIFSLQYAKSNYYVSVAVSQLNNLEERFSAAGNTSLTEQLSKWNKQNHDVLPQGIGMLSSGSSSQVISIFWGKRSEQICKTNHVGQSGCLRIML